MLKPFLFRNKIIRCFLCCLIILVIFLLIQVPHEMCKIGTVTALNNRHDKYETLDAICRNYMTDGFLSLELYQLYQSFTPLITVEFINGTCEIWSENKLSYHCFADYVSVSLINVTDLHSDRVTCYDPNMISVAKRETKQGRGNWSSQHQAPASNTSIYEKDSDSIICDVQCESSNVSVNILQTIEGIQVRKYEDTRKIDLHLDKYEYTGTYICQIVFPDQRLINGSSHQITVHGIFTQKILV